MTEIEFHRYAADKGKFACALIEREWLAGRKVAVYTADSAQANAIDRLLWMYQQLKFVPHCRKGASVEADTPVVVIAAAEETQHHEVIVNLTDEPPPPFATYERLIEVVADDDADKARARDRYRYYRDRGYPLTVHDV